MPLVQIQRGVPGSGKSYRAQRAKEGYEALGKRCVIVSADDYFMHNGTYHFDPRKLNDAHARCYRLFLDAFFAPTDAVIVDNTNVQLWHFENYLMVAQLAGCEIVVDEILPGSDEEIRSWHARCQHGVPLESLLRMRSQWQKFDLEVWRRAHPVPTR